MSERGESYLMTVQGMAEHTFWSRYVTGNPEDLVSRFLDEDTDILSLVLRVCAFAQRFYSGGVTAAEVPTSLESEFGAFQQHQRAAGWRWSGDTIEAAIQSLVQPRLLEVD